MIMCRRTLYFLVALITCVVGLSAAAQVQRNFPASALRGAMVVASSTEVTLNGKPARLAPGSRIRSQTNMLELSGGLMGQTLAVHYTIDTNGQVKDVWILTPQEFAVQPWPKTPLEAQRWQFDTIAQTWTKP